MHIVNRIAMPWLALLTWVAGAFLTSSFSRGGPGLVAFLLFVAAALLAAAIFVVRRAPRKLPEGASGGHAALAFVLWLVGALATLLLAIEVSEDVVHGMGSVVGALGEHAFRAISALASTGAALGLTVRPPTTRPRIKLTQTEPLMPRMRDDEEPTRADKS